jgi:hypothetical protein
MTVKFLILLSLPETLSHRKENYVSRSQNSNEKFTTLCGKAKEILEILEILYHCYFAMNM